MMNNQYFADLAKTKPLINWQIEYVQNGEYRTAYYRNYTLIDALNRFAEDTRGRAYVVYVGIPED